MRNQNEIIIKACSTFTVVLFSAFVLSTQKPWWGFNHPIFLDDTSKYLILILLSFSIGLLFIKDSDTIEIIFSKTNSILFGKNVVTALSISAILTLLFFWFRVETYFLGDGYTCISIFEHEQGFILKFTEYLSTYFIRSIQSIVGEYSKETSLLSFRFLSFFSGFLTVFITIRIIAILFKKSSVRILSLFTLVFSGSILLYFGYVEFYPILWVFVSLYLFFALRLLETGKGLTWVIICFILSLGMHLQAFYLIGGFAVLVLFRFHPNKQITKLPSNTYIILGFLFSVGLGFLFYNIITHFEIALLFLPLFEGRSRTPGYAVFSVEHLFDISNLILLMFPGILILIAKVIFGKKDLNWKGDWKFWFFVMSSAGSVLFLLLVEPYIGMARDWDLMSLTLLFPIFLLLYLIEISRFQISKRTIFVYGLICTIITGSFIAVNVNKDSSVRRYYTLLTNDNDNRSRTGWLILANYYKNSGNEQAQTIIAEMNRRFPHYILLDQAYKLIDSGDYTKANQIARSLLIQYPNNFRFFQLMGNVHIGYKQFDKAENMFAKALLMNPYSISIKNDMGRLHLQNNKPSEAVDIFEELVTLAPNREDIAESLGSAYINMNQLDKAQSVARTLFTQNSNSPTGHLIMMLLLSKSNQTEKAKYHYQEFSRYGKNHSDYNEILGYFKILSE